MAEFERHLRQAIRAYGDTAVRRVDPSRIAESAERRAAEPPMAVRPLRISWLTLVVALLILAALAATAGSRLPRPPDLLSTILDRGSLRVGVDPEALEPIAPPPGAADPAGGDVRLARQLAERLGVDLVLVPIIRADQSSGGWNGRLDVVIDELVVTSGLEGRLVLGRPYRFIPYGLAVPVGSGVNQVPDLVRPELCVEAGDHAEAWVSGRLQALSARDRVDVPPPGARLRREAASLRCARVVEGAATGDEGWIGPTTTIDAAIRAGFAIRRVGDPVFTLQHAIAADRHGPDPTSLLERLDALVSDVEPAP